jgi:hypothetical protein
MHHPNPSPASLTLWVIAAFVIGGVALALFLLVVNVS